MLTTKNKAATRSKRANVRLTDVVNYIHHTTRYHEISIISLNLGNRIDQYAIERGIRPLTGKSLPLSTQKPSVNRNVKSNL